MPKPLLRKVLIVWAMLLIGQFLLAAAVIYQSLMTGVPLLNALLSMQPVLAGSIKTGHEQGCHLRALAAPGQGFYA